ncbi:hypothetical protein CHELA1G11_21693 [Hyphomicrobiales bacterium]|nr:hypothetical protein CHELA1G11_21693 [Hyphomicrobiales bacterium]CAH1695476.1 hypothetical protein CHELA1G2_21998 [Hyphomicrobiales bacterium]
MELAAVGKSAIIEIAFEVVSLYKALEGSGGELMEGICLRSRYCLPPRCHLLALDRPPRGNQRSQWNS